MVDGSDVAGVVGAGLVLVGGLAVAKVAMDMTKELGKQTKGKKVKFSKYDPTQRAVKRILG